MNDSTAAHERPEPAALYDTAPCGLLSTHPDGLIETVNQTFLDWTGFRREDLVGARTFASLLTSGGRIYHETHFAPALRMHDIVRAIALDVVRVDGSRLPALVTSALTRDDGGSPLRIRTAVFDATDRRSYERELLDEKRRAEQSEEQARILSTTLQQTLMPPEVPRVPGLDVAAVYRPAGRGDEIGGDFYDVFQLGSNDWVIAVGDVEGKGVGAAVVTALVRYTIRAAAVEHDDVVDVLRVLNDVLRRSETRRLCTALIAHCRRRRNRWTVSIGCAGHPLPLLLKPGHPPVRLGRSGTVLGFAPGPEFSSVTVTLDAASALLLYTDGVTEARYQGEFYGDARLEAFASQPRERSAELAAALLDHVLEFQHDNARDDIAIVAIRTADA